MVITQQAKEQQNLSNCISELQTVSIKTDFVSYLQTIALQRVAPVFLPIQNMFSPVISGYTNQNVGSNHFYFV
jgi:hypothetical protein